jgi:IPT/TIG domain
LFQPHEDEDGRALAHLLSLSPVEILGEGFTTASSVKFGSALSNFTVYSDTYLTVFVPSAAKTGTISMTTRKGTFVSRQAFKVLH